LSLHFQCLHIVLCVVHCFCQQPDQIIGTASDISESLTGESSGSAAAESADIADDVWSQDMQSSVIEDVDEAVAVDHVKRGSLEFHEDLLHIKPYVKLLCIGQRCSLRCRCM